MFFFTLYSDRWEKAWQEGEKEKKQRSPFLSSMADSGGGGELGCLFRGRSETALPGIHQDAR